MAQPIAAFGGHSCWFGHTGNIPLVATTMLPRIFLQQTTIKPHITNLPVETAYNENKDTLVTMAQPAATLGLPWLPRSRAVAFRAIPTNVKGEGRRARGEREKGEGRKKKSDGMDLPKL
jgi:hypothetical protein